MNTKKVRNQNKDLYTYTEFKEKFFPGADIDLVNDDSSITKEVFLEVLKKISRPVGAKKLNEKEKKET